MKKNMLILLAILMASSSIFAMDIEIGNGITTSSNIPYNGLYEYGWSNFIISSDQIGTAAEFNQIQFSVSSDPNNFATVDQKIYFKETTAATVTATYPNPVANGFSLVYEGPVTWHGNGFQGVMLDTPFNYNGTSNLQIVWENHSGQWGTYNPNYFTTDVGSNVAAYKIFDGSFPDSNGTVVTYFPNLVLSYEAENAPTGAIIVAPANNAMNVPTSTNLQWQMGQNVTDVDVYFSESRSDVSTLAPSSLVVDGLNLTSYEVTDLSVLTDYYWRVMSRNSDNGLIANGPLWKFSTDAGNELVSVSIGHETTSTYEYPFNFFYKNSISETIYLSEEINISGELTNIAFYNNFSSIIPNKFVNIWIGETTEPDLTNYIPASQLTPVFSGNIDFPAGQNMISIELDTPFNYGGGNLVVLTERPLEENYYSSSDKFLNTATDLANRTVWWQSDTAGYNPNNMTGGTRENKMPNISLYFTVEGMGSVVGTVTDGTTGIGGVNIAVDNTNYHTLSLTDGTFELPYLPENNDYTLTASKFGFYDAAATFNVVENEETSVNITMSVLPTVEVSGQVIANESGLGVQANIILTGYNDYEVISAADGYFTIPGVFNNQTYSGTASADGYQPGAFTAVVGETDLDLGTIMVTETLYPASEVVAELVGNDAVITWNEPGVGAGEWLTKGADESHDGVGSGGPLVMSVAHMYTEEELVYYQGLYINSIKFFPREPLATFTLKIWSGANGQTELYSQAVPSFTNLAWNEVQLNSSVLIPSSGPVYIGYFVDTPGGWPSGCDAGPAIPGGDMIILGAGTDWASLAATTPINCNWNIKAFVSSTRSSEIASSGRQLMPIENTQATQINSYSQLELGNLDPITYNINYSRAFVGYNVYRFLVADEDNLANWDLVEAETTALTYTDTAWSTLPGGYYKYGVRAVYTNGAEATPAISNWLAHEVMNLVTVNVDSNLGGAIADANIFLLAQTASPNGEFDSYEGTTNAAGTATLEVNTGMYDITVTANNFASTTEEVNVTGDVTVNITLEELANPPSAVFVEEVDQDALITWALPGSGGLATTESFEESFPPTEWEIIATNLVETWTRYETIEFAEGNVTPTEGMYQVGVMWNLGHQDEWLITDEMNCPAGNLTFDFYGPEGSPHGDNYFVKISTDNGNTWTPIWNASDLPVAVNHYDRPIVLSLGDYVGQNVKFAWNNVDGDGQGLWYASYIDNISFGGTRIDTRDLVAVSKAGNRITRSGGSDVSQMRLKRDASEVFPRTEAVTQTAQVSNPTTRGNNRALLGYKVWRLLASEQETQTNWTLLTTNMIDAFSYRDTDWNNVPQGSYKYAVKAIYTDENVSNASFSNFIHKDMQGTVSGIVTDESNTPIHGAVINFRAGTTISDNTGYFLFTDVLAGDYEITASAPDYISATESITVVGNQVTTVDFSLASSGIIISDSFEEYPDFALEAAPWVMHDGDLSSTYGIDQADYLNAEEPMAYMIFNPTMTMPPLPQQYYAYSGSKYAACFAAVDGLNDDWMMTEAFTLDATGTISFWARSVTDQYGLERFRVLVSTNSTDPNDFTAISGPTYVEAPTEWTQYSYILDEYAYSTIRVAIQCVSNDIFMFMVDHVEVEAPEATDNTDNEVVVAISALGGNYPNPFNPETRIAFSTKENGPVSLDIYNIRGQKVRTLINDNREAGKHTVVWNGKDDNGKSVASGVFFYRMKSGKFSSTKKMILMK